MSIIIGIASQNENKLAEFTELLKHDQIILQPIKMELSEIQSLDLFEIAKNKLNQASNLTIDGLDYLLIDDTSLEIEDWGGFPGPFIKWQLQTMKLTQIYRLVSTENNIARAICLLGLYDLTTKKSIFFKGEVLGLIVEPIESSFGWDGIFQPLNYNSSFAAMTSKQKNSCSHRYIATRNLLKYIIHQIINK